MEAIVAPVEDMAALEGIVATSARDPNSGLIVMPDAFTIGHHADITSLAARYRVPTVYPFRIFAEVGGLLSYGSSALDEFRRAASYADRILKVRNRASCPSRSQSISIWLSTLRPQRRWVWTCPHPFGCVPTR